MTSGAETNGPAGAAGVLTSTATATMAQGSAARCDTSTQCGWCGGPMRPEHAHYRCTACGQRDSCCDGPY